jgi:hypothetical protein
MVQLRLQPGTALSRDAPPASPSPQQGGSDSHGFSLQVAQVLLTLPYSFSQLGMLSGVLLQIFYGFLGSWTAYIISVLYVEYRSRKEKEGVSFKNHVIQVWPLASFVVFPSAPPLPPLPCRHRLQEPKF